MSESRSVQVEGPEQLAEQVRIALEAGTPLVDYGVAHGQLGNPPRDGHIAISQTGSIIEHYERDFTVRAAAGTTIADLHEQLLARGQFIPFDADGDLTLGEAILCNVYGPMRIGFNAIRDWLLGLRYIDGEGKDIHVGGRTVKNVAGYDVSRLMVGSLGELGFPYEATVRTYAVPEQVAAVELTCDNPSAVDRIMTDWLLTEASPGSMCLWRDLDESRWAISVAYYGWPSANASQRRSLETFVDTQPSLHIAGSAQTTLEDDVLQRAAYRAWRREAPAVVRIVMPPSRTGHAALELHHWADENEHRLHIEALPAHGCLFVGGDLDAEAVRSLDKVILEMLSSDSGFRAWHKLPDSDSDDAVVERFKPMPVELPMLQQLKKTMDPHAIFNPGRLIPV